MKERWQQLSDRERNIITIGGGLLLLCLCYFYIWSPFSNSVSNLQTGLQSQRSLLHWMQQVVPKITSLEQSGIASATMISDADRLSTIDTSLKQNDLRQYVTSFTQTSDANIALHFTAVPFDNLISWLSQTWQQHLIKVSQANIVPDKTSGLVDADIQLSH